MNTKLLIIISCSLLSFSLEAQQINLMGQVSIHNSKYNTGTIKYVKNVQIIADFTSPAITDTEGKFELEFVGLSKGTSISISVEKEGLELVNDPDLQDIVLGRLTPVKVFLAPKGQVIKAQTEIYNISIEVLTAQHEKIIQELKKDNANTQKVINELEQRLGRTIANRFEAEKILNEQLSNTKRRLPEFARELATTNLDFASEMYRKAYAYVKAGEIEKAIETLDEKVLDKDADNLVISFRRIKKSINNLDSAMVLEKERYDTNIQALLLKAEGYQKQFEYHKAIGSYHNVLELEEESMFQNLQVKEKCFFNLWKLYQKNNQNEKERAFRQKHLSVVKNNSYVAELPEYLEGLSIAYEKVALDSSILFQSEVLDTLIHRKVGVEEIQNARSRLLDLLTLYASQLDSAQSIEQIFQIFQKMVQLFIDNKELENAVNYQRKTYELLKNKGESPTEETKQQLIVLLKLYANDLEENSRYKEAISTIEQLLSFQPKNKTLKKRIKNLKKKIK